MKIQFKFLGILLAALLFCTGLRAEAAQLGADWNTNSITVTGMGVAPTGMRGVQARMLARRAAVADAYRLLAESEKGVQVDASTTVEMAMTTSDVVNLKVSALIKGAQVISESEIEGGGYEVTMQIPMFGVSGGLAEAVLERPAVVEPFPEPQVSVKVNVEVKGGYTGLIVDCRGLRVNPVMSPVIKNANGQKIYGHKNLDYDKVIEFGMASYADNMAMATRAGSNPLIVKALETEDFNANPVVSNEDANLILRENKISKFLDNTAVVFLY